MYSFADHALQNLSLLQKSLPESTGLSLWQYSLQGELMGTTCRIQELYPVFESMGRIQKVRQTLEEKAGPVPFTVGSSIGLCWAAALERSKKADSVYLLGPVFLVHPSADALRKVLPSSSWARGLIKVLPQIPVLTYGVLLHYALMLHNLLNAEKLGPEAFQPPSPRSSALDVPDQSHDRVEIYQAEQMMLDMVREGNIGYAHALLRSSSLSFGVPIQGKDPLRQAKTNIIVFTTLVCRAAMEGGLSPEISYPLGDSYIQAAEDCRESGELSALGSAMYHDFIYRVHQLKADPSYSHTVQKCCDYIELSLDRPIHAKELAALTGYTEYYLTEKFKKETGLTVSSYVRRARIEQAKRLLVQTRLSVAAIAEQLAFNTPNYFIQCFRTETGRTPAGYRKQQLTSPDPG